MRSLLQKRLTGDLTVNGAAYVRFGYGLPFAWAYALVMWGGALPPVGPEFVIYVFFGAIAQIVGTSALIASFTQGSFAVGTAYSKTEAAQAAVFGLVVLGDAVGLRVVGGIVVSLAGVLMLSGRFRLYDLVRPGRAMWMGLLSGAGFAISAVCFRGASLAVDAGTTLERATLAVMATVTLQTIVMGAYLRAREPGQLTRVLRAWRVALWVGAIGATSSVGWFTAMTLTNAAVVRAVGQVELLFATLTSIWLFGEHLTGREILGMGLVVGGIVLLI